MANPLLTIRFEIPFDAITAEHVEPAIDELLEDAQAHVDAIVDLEGDRTYDNTLGALEAATERLEYAAGIVSHLESVATYPELRDAYDAIQPKLSRFWTSLTLNPGLWRALNEFAGTDQAKALDLTRQRQFTRLLDEFRRQGAELDDTAKEQVAALNVELAQLTTRFAQNVLDSTNEFELVIDDESGLAGLPDSAREAARESARAQDMDGWRFTLQSPSLLPILTYLDDRAVREHVWRAYNRRATDGKHDNISILSRTLEIRHHKARILGYADFADLVLEDRMAATGHRAAAFVDDLRDKTRASFHRENEQLEAFRRATDPDGEPLAPWDISYYAEKMRKTEYHFDEEELRPYFPVEGVLTGLYETVRRLYDVHVETVADMPTWEPAVRTYRLLSGDGDHLGSFYVDLYPRENKRDGAWMNSLIVSAPPAPHLGLICANANPPVGNKPALLTHREVETLFHEFGHLLHHLLSTVPIRSIAGTNVAWDFVELPSQIMENWCWEREALDLFAHHWESGQPIPDALFDKMKRARAYRAANAQMRQLGFASVDLALHRDYAKNPTDDPAGYARGIFQEHAPTPLPSDYGFIASFSHLFSSSVGYAAGYYSYKWAEVLDADAFTRFLNEGIFSPEVGDAFRREILARGDSREPMELYKAFAGREPDLEPLLARQGLLAPNPE